MVAQNIAFWIIAAAMVIGAIRVVTTNNIVHAALWLVLVLGAWPRSTSCWQPSSSPSPRCSSTSAPSSCCSCSASCSPGRIGRADDLDNRQWPIALVVALVLAGMLGYVLIEAFGKHELPRIRPSPTTQQVSDSIFSTYLVPFWALSVVLLAALIGAIVLARRD